VQAPVVLMIFESYATGLYSMDQLADELNSRGFCPRSKQGKLRFSKASVQGMLKNPVYAGYVTRHGEILGDGLHEAVVPRDLFARVQQVIAQRARKPRSYSQQPPYPYLLAGVAYCASCGGPLWANSAAAGRYHYYRCPASLRGEVCSDDGISTRIDAPEAMLAAMFERMRLPDTWQERVRLLTLQDEDKDSIREQERYWQRHIERAKEGFRADLLTATEASATKREAEDHLRELGSRHSSVAIGSALIMTDMCEAWPHLSPAERRDAVRIMLADVRIDVRRGDVLGIRPADSFAPLFQAVAESGGAVGFCDWRPRAGSTSPAGVVPDRAGHGAMAMRSWHDLTPKFDPRQIESDDGGPQALRRVVNLRRTREDHQKPADTPRPRTHNREVESSSLSPATTLLNLASTITAAFRGLVFPV